MKGKTEIKMDSVFKIVLLMVVFAVAVAGQSTDEATVEKLELAEGVEISFVSIPASVLTLRLASAYAELL